MSIRILSGRILLLAGSLAAPFLAACGSDSTSPPRGPLGLRDSAYVCDASAAPDTLSVATLNMSIGFDVQSLAFLDLDQPEIVQSKALAMLDQFDSSRARERVRRMADTILALRPDVIGLQEVLRLRTSLGHSMSFFDTLLADLRAGGADYRGVLDTLNDYEMTVPQAGELPAMTVAMSEGNAILFRSDLIEVQPGRASYLRHLQIPLLGQMLEVDRAVSWITFRKPGGGRYQVFTTHIEVPTLKDFHNGQLTELEQILLEERAPGIVQIVLGDLNADPPVVAAKFEPRGFEDVWKIGADASDSGFTCCVDTLWRSRSFASTSSERIDYILSEAACEATATRHLTETVALDSAGLQGHTSDHILVFGRLVFRRPPVD